MTKLITAFFIPKYLAKGLFVFFLLMLVNGISYAQKTTNWTQKPSSSTWESISSDGLVRVECRITGGVSITGNETMGCISNNTYGNPDPAVFGETSLGVSINPLFTGTIAFHFFDAITGDEVFITNPFLNVDKVGTYGLLPLGFITGTNTGVFESTNGTWTNIGNNGDIFQFTNTEFTIDADALLSFNGGECGDNSFYGTGGGTMRMDEAVKSINMDVESKEDFEKKIEEQLQTDIKANLKTKTKQRIFDTFESSNQIDIPQSMIISEANNLRNNAAQQMGMDTSKLEDDKFPIDNFKDNALKRVRLGVLINKLIEENNIVVDKDTLKKEIEDKSKSYKDPEQYVNWIYGNEEQLKNIESLVLEDKVAEYLENKSKVEEESLSFEEVVSMG